MIVRESSLSRPSIELIFGVIVHAKGRAINAFQTAINYSMEVEVDANRFNCPSSECRWPLFNTLKVCAQTWNVTKYLRYYDGHVSLPNGISVMVGFNERLTLWTGSDPISHDVGPFNNNETDQSGTALTNAFIVYENGTEYSAIEILFQLCVNRYNMSVSRNVLFRTLQSSSTEATAVEAHLYQGDMINVQSIVSPDDNNEKFPFGGKRFTLMKSTLRSMLTGSVKFNRSEYLPADNNGRIGWLISDADTRKQRGQVMGDPFTEVVTNITRNVAAGLSGK